MINCLIVDDEPLARQVLKSHILNTPALRLIKECANAFEAFNIINSEHIELLFLDIQMPSLSGIDFIKSLKNPPKIIFTTAFSEFAVQSYELNAIDYLLKPITYTRFSSSITKYRNVQARDVAHKPYFYFKVNGKMLRIETGDIRYARSVKDYIVISTSKGNYITHMTMKYLADLLPSDRFMQVHRSYIVGTGHISAIGRQAIEIGEDKIPIGDKYRTQIDTFTNSN